MSEHYRQMLVRDGQRRFDEWHTNFLRYQLGFLKDQKKFIQLIDNERNKQKLVGDGETRHKKKEPHDKLKVKKSKQSANNKPDKQKLGAAGKNPRKEKELHDKFVVEKLQESIAGEHYRQRLVRDGERRYKEWHNSYHEYIRNLRN
ncbi:MAG: hypothetical protein O4861_00375 [Trichodesmium sp. St16_bin4-tuft]|nr:hypothetical protein [Trichodesmium sp. St4_bin8_1]MDE5074417.1 hypothetical protein [Trichodesmium sp. St5_bin8]MDE5079221.1 hypothetical protein [Trichodesmium sp. St2_bin6]MDE5090970.1 hypothetical protein [Trichodesmium sp. St18_bin3_1_1]MDE5096874.1 hypothetical protein [Trichodesmium sp. St16_bin4-tuft]MDE5104301.1 hypothetical protein [Trichodesmium sp. St19_bin2]